MESKIAIKPTRGMTSNLPARLVDLAAEIAAGYDMILNTELAKSEVA